MKTISAVRLVMLMGTWSSGSGPLHRKLAVALKLLIDEGQLSPLVRLPSERALAIALLVSRTTVMGAYDELKAEGYLVSAQGSGTWVAPGRPGRVAQAEGLHLFPWLHRLGPLSGPQGAGVIDLSAVAVPASQ